MREISLMKKKVEEEIVVSFKNQIDLHAFLMEERIGFYSEFSEDDDSVKFWVLNLDVPFNIKEHGFVLKKYDQNRNVLIVKIINLNEYDLCRSLIAKWENYEL